MRNAREQRRGVLFKQSGGSERGTENDARAKPYGFRELLVFTHYAKSSECCEDVHATFPRSLPHVRKDRLVNSKRHAFFQLPAEHRQRLLRGAGKLLEVLNKDANHWIRQEHRNIFVLA